MCIRDSHITVWRNDITYEESDGGYLVSDVLFTEYDRISSAAEFDAAYFRQGEYVIPDYKAKGLSGPLQEHYDTNMNADYYTPLTEPDYACLLYTSVPSGRRGVQTPR